MSEQTETTIEAKRYCCNEMPFVVTLIPSGTPNSYLEVYEDPFEHSCKLTTIEKFEERWSDYKEKMKEEKIKQNA